MLCVHVCYKGMWDEGGRLKQVNQTDEGTRVNCDSYIAAFRSQSLLCYSPKNCAAT